MLCLESDSPIAGPFVFIGTIRKKHFRFSVKEGLAQTNMGLTVNRLVASSGLFDRNLNCRSPLPEWFRSEKNAAGRMEKRTQIKKDVFLEFLFIELVNHCRSTDYNYIPVWSRSACPSGFSAGQAARKKIE